MNTNIFLAFAVGHSETFESCHFGDADKFLIYEWNSSTLTYKSELINSAKDLDIDHEHGSKKKGNAIIDLLQRNEVKILVSKQFGKNIQMVNRFFIPVVIANEKIEDVVNTLTHYFSWLEDELENNTNNYKLFTIRKGILKTEIRNTNNR